MRIYKFQGAEAPFSLKEVLNETDWCDEEIIRIVNMSPSETVVFAENITLTRVQ